MREIRQGDYNPDELAMEVINAIANSLAGEIVAVWNSRLDALLTADTKIFYDYARNDSARAYADEPGMREIEEDWRSIGRKHGIEVYDDGEAGWTYVGSATEIEEFQNRQEADL